jgi:hypothetical protein
VSVLPPPKPMPEALDKRPSAWQAWLACRTTCRWPVVVDLDGRPFECQVCRRAEA